MMKPSLPAIPGVRPLSRNEIKKDLLEIESYDRSDTESNSSVASDDVLTSSYPVKPRRHPKAKIENRSKSSSKQETEIDQASVEDTIEFLKLVETARPDIYEAEKEREELEIKYQALRDMCISKEETFKKRKTALESYLRIIQSQSRNVFQQYDTLSLHNALLYDLLIALKSRRKTCTQLGLNSNQNINEMISLDCSEKSPSSTLYFYLSQVLQTPQGVGTVVAIDRSKPSLTVSYSDSNSLTQEYTLQELYSYFTSDSSFIFSNSDLYHLSNLQKKWSSSRISSQQDITPVTPLQKNIQHITSLTEEDLDSLIAPINIPQASEPSPPVPPPPPPATSKKTKRGSQKHVTDDTTTSSTLSLPSTVPSTPLSLPHPLNVPLISREKFKPTSTTLNSTSLESQIPLLFIKPSTLPFVVEKTLFKKNDIVQSSSGNSSLTLELSSQAYSSSVYAHHSLPNPLDESFFESIGSNSQSISSYQTVDPSIENEIKKLQQILKPLLQRIHHCREETKSIALQVERSKANTIKQYHEMGAMRLGLFTHQILSRQPQSNNSDKGSHSQNENGITSNDTKSNNGKLDAVVNGKNSNSSKGGRKKTPVPTSTVTTSSNSNPPVTENNSASQRPRRRKAEKIDDEGAEFSQDNLEEIDQPTATKSKRPRR